MTEQLSPSPHKEIVLALRELRATIRLRLVAACVEPEDAYRLIWNAILDQPPEVWLKPGSSAKTALLRGVEEACQRFADIRFFPYRKVVRPLERNWNLILSMTAEAGLSQNDGEQLVRDLLRRLRPSTWERETDWDSALLREVNAACSLVAERKGLLYYGLTVPHRRKGKKSAARR